jgi:outer membrane protein assembly factor BamE (lipoprotein component of BamABCDE complex)
MKLTRYLMTLLPALGLLLGCVQFSSKRGVEVSWQPEVIAQLETGKSTREDVLSMLGPPSQVISVGDETVLYYLFEKSEGQGVILILYNQFDRETDYDRAVFFFDKDDVLIDYATQIKPDES